MLSVRRAACTSVPPRIPFMPMDVAAVKMEERRSTIDSGAQWTTAKSTKRDRAFRASTAV
jgi:hypothetical protein